MSAITPTTAQEREACAKFAKERIKSHMDALIAAASAYKRAQDRKEDSHEWMDLLAAMDDVFPCDDLEEALSEARGECGLDSEGYPLSDGWTPSEGDTRYWSDADKQRVFGGVR
jgi:hypothetical protein